MKTNLITFLFCLITIIARTQSVQVEGYVYESDNRGYLESAIVEVQLEKDSAIQKVITNREGYFSFQSESGQRLTLNISKPLYDAQEVLIDVPTDKEKYFVNVEMIRSPGYLFEVTIAEERTADDIPVDGIKGYRIDVYNNTAQKEEFVLEEYNQPVFSVPLFKENHYTILIRKKGYTSKRIEAFVDIEGCILCFEGLGSIEPGVSETLSERNQIGVLLANVSLSRAYAGKKMQINDIYYDLGKWKLKSKSKKELSKLAILMKDNPRWIVELGSHTDSRGTEESNMVLSEKRAKSAVDFLVYEKHINRNRISAKGYGESVLVNGCDDSKYCTEKKHLENRRTEIEIVGMAEIMRYPSLAEIKQSENMDALLKEIQFGGQVMLPVYDETQDSILQAKRDSIENSLLAIEETNADVEEESNTTFNETMNKDSTVLNGLDQESTENNPSELMDDKIDSIDNKNDERVTTNENNDGQSTENVESEEESMYLVKIVILESKEPISSSHNIYETHKDVSEIYHNGLYKYLIGKFNSMVDAKKFLKESARLVYPKAYVVRFN